MTQNLNQLSELHSATCFLNALLREWHDYVVYQSASKLYVFIDINHQEAIQIPLLKFSFLGRHQYTGQFYLRKENDLIQINFATLVQRLCEKRVNTSDLSLAQLNVFISDVLSSRENIHHALTLNADSFHENNAYDFKKSEQALLIGHNFHPTPKSRDTFNHTDLKHYAPECKAEFQLDWLLVDSNILQNQSAECFKNHHWLLELFQQDYAESHHIPQRMLPFPMHPWQWQYLQNNPLITQYIKNKQIISIGKSKLTWSATSSLRTVYREACSYMLKFSMNLKLTNSVRVLLSSEVARGLLLHDVLATTQGKQFREEFPNFHIMTEPAAISMIDAEGNPIESTMIICRQNLFNDDKAKNKFMLATLTQDNPFGGTNLLLTLLQKSHTFAHHHLKKWFADFLRITIEPLITAYAKYGIIMEGHQQNIVLALENGFPVAAYFRDCQDHAYSDDGYHLFAHEVPGMKNNPHCIANKEIGCRYFIYQVILNSTFNVITTLAKSNDIHELELLNDLHDFFQQFKNKELKDPYCLNKLLEETILHKCNFQFALRRINDNQLPFNPLDLYTALPNLMSKKHDITANYHPNILYHRYFKRINKTITLRAFDLNNDFILFLEWQRQPRVAKYWDLDQSPEEVKTYLQEIIAAPYHQPLMIEINHEPAGYCEVYWAAQDRIAKHYDHQDFDRGFHLLIGAEHLLGIENTTSLFEAIIHYLYLDHHQTQHIVVEPDANNQRFIKYMHLIPGWKYIKDIYFTEKRAALFMLQRHDFILEGVQ